MWTFLLLDTRLGPLYNLNLARLLDRNGIGQYSTVASIRALAQRSLSTRASVSFRFTLRASLACAHRLDQLYSSLSASTSAAVLIDLLHLPSCIFGPSTADNLSIPAWLPVCTSFRPLGSTTAGGFSSQQPIDFLYRLPKSWPLVTSQRCAANDTLNGSSFSLATATIQFLPFIGPLILFLLGFDSTESNSAHCFVHLAQETGESVLSPNQPTTSFLDISVVGYRHHASSSRTQPLYPQHDGGTTTYQSPSSSVLQCSGSWSSIFDNLSLQLQSPPLLPASVTKPTGPRSKAKEVTETKDLHDTTQQSASQSFLHADSDVELLLPCFLFQRSTCCQGNVAVFRTGGV